MGTPSDQFIRSLTSEHRVVALGGLAVIAHGNPRKTFLEDLVRQEYREKLPTATPAEATELLERFSDWQVLRAAGENPHAEVRELARRHLEEFAAAGDPFSQAILAGREIP